ncbi:MAG TPA: hypothetical protein VLY23_12290 [Candidatus Acidoferrum sp.]|nr:hypothetical protein [Candidatus Acidoferrum sp.]
MNIKGTARLGAFSFVALLLLGSASGSAQDSVHPKIKASAIQILMVGSNEVDLPLPFQVALYENVIEQVQKTKKFEHVYRDGDRAAADAPGLVILRTNVFGFKRGSEEERQVTTVAGATQIKVHCQFTDKSGKSLLEQDVTGNVRFIGGNLRATYDFAKKVSQIVVKNFS